MTPRPNHLAKMNLKNQKKIAAGLVSDRFPEVNTIKINLEYFWSEKNTIVMKRIINVFPSTYAYFNMDCKVSGCSEGGFDLTRVIAAMVRDHRELEKGTLTCNGKIAGLEAEHANINYEVAIQFNK